MEKIGYFALENCRGCLSKKGISIELTTKLLGARKRQKMNLSQDSRMRFPSTKETERMDKRERIAPESLILF